MPSTRALLTPLPALLLLSLTPALPAAAAADPAPAQPASYYKQVRPIFQAHCQGCHQPAKAQGGYSMSEVAQLLDKGDSDKPGVVPGQPGQSELVRQITPNRGGRASMPRKGRSLHEGEVELISRWIAEGAKDDTPANARVHFDADHPPAYTRPPVITALDFSPDGKLLAVAGFHEVLLADADSGKLVGRLVGLSERVQSVKFSPD